MHEWRDGLIALAARRPRVLTLDLRRVTFVDASVVVTLRALERRLIPGGGSLALLVPASLATTLRFMGLSHLVADPLRTPASAA